MTLRFTIPGRLASEPNQRGNWKAKHFGRTEPQRRKARNACPKWAGAPLLVVTLWRFGVRLLDSDNLQGALKAYRDGIASKLGVDDGSALVSWRYHQGTCPSGQERVEVVVSRASPGDALLATAEKHLEEVGEAFTRGVSKSVQRAWKLAVVPATYRGKRP